MMNDCADKKNLTPSKRGNANGGTSPNRVDDDGVSKKRNREQMEQNNAHIQSLQFQGLGSSSDTKDSDQIVKIMKDLKERVLKGETMNVFKKEISNLSVLIDKSENQQMFEKSVYYLAQILQKGEEEISWMLKRNCLQDKKKKEKKSIDNKRQTISQILERDLRDANTKAYNENKPKQGSMVDLERSYSIVTLDQLDPNNFVFCPSEKMIEFFEDLKINMQKFVTINNEYIQIKL